MGKGVRKYCEIYWTANLCLYCKPSKFLYGLTGDIPPDITPQPPCCMDSTHGPTFSLEADTAPILPCISNVMAPPELRLAPIITHPFELDTPPTLPKITSIFPSLRSKSAVCHVIPHPVPPQTAPTLLSVTSLFPWIRFQSAGDYDAYTPATIQYIPVWCLPMKPTRG